MMKQSYMRILVLLMAVCVALWVAVALGAGIYERTNDSTTAELTQISATGDTLYVSFTFKNSGDDKECFSFNYIVEAWQDGCELEKDYSNTVNTVDYIMGNTSLNVTEAFKLKNQNNFIKVTFDELFTWGSKATSIFFNPSSGKWGTEEEMAAEKPPTSKPAEKPANSPEDKDENTWVCLNCGMENTMLFCPNCGQPKPESSSMLTPTPMPISQAIPMDSAVSADNVVQYDYTLQMDEIIQEGKYTGEIVDKLPHGYGVFVADDQDISWVCIGTWENGVPGEDTEYFYGRGEKKGTPVNIQVGDSIKFGTYPQTSAGTDQTPIEWIVLDYDEANHRALLISKYGLDVLPYNKGYNPVTWETCSLRAWLNNEFLNKAFSAEEQSAILITNVDNGADQSSSGIAIVEGNNTQDQIFLLSYAEANRYMDVKYDVIDNQKSRVAPTAYAKAQGARTDKDKTVSDEPAGWWLLRSIYTPSSVDIVGSSGSLRIDELRSTRNVVRPALWVNLETDFF